MSVRAYIKGHDYDRKKKYEITVTPRILDKNRVYLDVQTDIPQEFLGQATVVRQGVMKDQSITIVIEED